LKFEKGLNAFRFAAAARAALLLGAVAMVPVGTAGLAAVDGRVAPQFGRLFTVYQLIKANYVDQTDDDKLVKGAIDGMLSSLDPHSSYLEGASLDRLRTMIDGGYAGLGLSVVQDDGAVKVISPMRAARPKRRASRRATISPISTASSSWRRSGRCRGKDARRAGHADQADHLSPRPR
jgi:carboxyl-terminal processing protease